MLTKHFLFWLLIKLIQVRCFEIGVKLCSKYLSIRVKYSSNYLNLPHAIAIKLLRFLIISYLFLTKIGNFGIDFFHLLLSINGKRLLKRNHNAFAMHLISFIL